MLYFFTFSSSYHIKKNLCATVTHYLIPSLTVNLTVDGRESFHTFIFIPHLVVKRVVKHGAEFLFRHVRIRIQHLEPFIIV